MSSGLNARHIEPWYLEDRDCRVLYEKRKENGAWVFYKMEHYVMMLSRQFVGYRDHREQLGESRIQFEYQVGGARIVGYRTEDVKWFCTRDHVAIKDFVTGEGQQDQTWEHYTEPEEVNAAEFGGAHDLSARPEPSP